MKHRILWLLILLNLLLLQMVFIPHVSLQNVGVDLLGMVVIAYALLQGKTEGLIMGLAAGFFSDSSVGYPFGLQILLKSSIGFWSGMLTGFYFEDQPLVPAVISMAGFIITELGRHLATVLFYNSAFWPGPRFWSVFFWSLLLEPFIFVLVYFTVRRILNKERQLGWLKD